MKEIPLTRGQVALVDDSDYEFLSQWKWQANLKRLTWYAQTTICKNKKKQTLQMGRLLLGLLPGDKRQVDHINHNPLDNRRDNIRICSPLENQRNRNRAWGRSKFRGVYKHSTGHGWVAQIGIRGKIQYLGYFKIEKNAALAYDTAATREFRDFANLNFPSFQRSLVC